MRFKLTLNTYGTTPATDSSQIVVEFFSATTLVMSISPSCAACLYNFAVYF